MFYRGAMSIGTKKLNARQNLLVAEDFIERLCSSGLNVFHRFRPNRIEPSCLRISLNLAIPGIVEIDLGKPLKKLGLVRLRQLLNRFDDFAYRAHATNLALTFLDAKSKEEALALLFADGKNSDGLKLLRFPRFSKN